MTQLLLTGQPSPPVWRLDPDGVWWCQRCGVHRREQPVGGCGCSPEIVLHRRGRCVGVLRDGSHVVTHNQVHAYDPAAWRVVDEAEVPDRLRPYLAGAARRARE